MPVTISIVIRDKEVGVNHFMQQRLHQILPRSELQKRDAQADGAHP